MVARPRSLVLLLAAACSPPPPDVRPDVLLVVLDALRADRTAVLESGRAVTPNLEALGHSGRVYRQAISPSSWTLPSMAGLFAGAEVTASRHAAFEGRPALAERFASAGYRTLALVANPLLTEANGFERGFERYHVAPARSTASLEADPAELRAWDAEALVARALAALEEAPRDGPVFLYLHLMDPHVPYDPAHERLAGWEPAWSGAGPEGPAPPLAWSEQLDPAQQQLLGGWRRAYDGQIRMADAALARLARHLEGLRGRPWLMAVSADHGEGLFSHALLPDSTRREGPLGEAYEDHGEQLYEEALRVPLWLLGQGVPPGEETRPVSLRDLGATLLHLAGVPAPAARLPLSAGDAVPEIILGTGTRAWFARSATHKLILPFPERAGRPGVQPRLYAVAPQHYTDEVVDLDADTPAGQALARHLQAWLAEHGEQRPSQPDAETLRRLRALGYVR